MKALEILSFLVWSLILHDHQSARKWKRGLIQRDEKVSQHRIPLYSAHSLTLPRASVWGCWRVSSTEDLHTKPRSRHCLDAYTSLNTRSLYLCWAQGNPAWRSCTHPFCASCQRYLHRLPWASSPPTHTPTHTQLLTSPPAAQLSAGVQLCTDYHPTVYMVLSLRL